MSLTPPPSSIVVVLFSSFKKKIFSGPVLTCPPSYGPTTKKNPASIIPYFWYHYDDKSNMKGRYIYNLAFLFGTCKNVIHVL